MKLINESKIEEILVEANTIENDAEFLEAIMAIYEMNAEEILEVI